MSIYKKKNYRTIIKNRIEDLKNLDKSISYTSVADALLIQKPYLSKVLNGRADFSQDQLFLACNFLNFDDAEAEYLELLLEFERSGNAKRRDILKKKIEAIRFEHSDAGKLTTAPENMTGAEFDLSDLTEYYLDPIISVVHVFLSIDYFRKNFEEIGTNLFLSQERLSEILKALERMKLIEVQGSKIKLLKSQLQLPRDSKIVIPNQKLMTQLCGQRKGDLPFSKKKSFYVTFAANEEAKEKISEEFNDFIMRVKDIAMNCKASHCYQLNFDLFPWS